MTRKTGENIIVGVCALALIVLVGGAIYDEVGNPAPFEIQFCKNIESIITTLESKYPQEIEAKSTINFLKEKVVELKETPEYKQYISKQGQVKWVSFSAIIFAGVVLVLCFAWGMYMDSKGCFII